MTEPTDHNASADPSPWSAPPATPAPSPWSAPPPATPEPSDPAAWSPPPVAPEPAASPWGPPAPGPSGPGAWNPPPAPPAPDNSWSAPTAPRAAYTPPPVQQYRPAGSYAPAGAPGWQPAPTGQWETLGGPATPPPGRRGRGRFIASIVAVVALAGGGVATYAAMSDSNSAGASSAEGAIRTLVSDINNSDLIGVLDDLAPGERTALANPFIDAVNQLKRTKVLKGAANPSKVSGLNLAVKGLTFSGKTIPLTSTVQVVEITGGTLDVSSDVRAVPFTDDFVKAVFPHGLPDSGNTSHVDIAQQVQQNGEPLRVAAQKVGGKWYPSLGYTIAYYAANEQAPTASDAIPAKGANSADAAVRGLVDAALSADLARIIELASPDELAAVHTYGGLIMSNIGRYDPPGVTIDELTFTDKSINNGTRVFLKSLKFHSRSGDSGSLTVNGHCFDIVANGDSKHTCPTQTVADVIQQLQDDGLISDVTPAQRTAFLHLVSGLGSVGVDTSESGGQWYVDPVRTYMDFVNEALSGLQGDDAIVLLKLITQH